jgi:RNA polymerase-interacting CarD/CdnL/TRCF family regulator
MSIPSYIQKAYLNVNEIKIICEMHDVDYRLVLKDQEIPDELSVSSAVRCAKLVNNLIKASNRAKISYNKFVDRIELIPEETDFSSDILYDPYKEEEKHMEAALVVEKLKKFMDEEELRICDGIMLDKTYDEIGSEMGKSKAWVAGKIESLRERILYVVNK